MNFFGHAAVASWADRHPEFVLGSMLPDFESMLRGRVTHLESAHANRGVAFHHKTDDAFHQRRAFVTLCSETLDELTVRGVRRGTSRAVAHLGTEMFLDGWLAATDGYRDAYRSAIDSTQSIAATWTRPPDEVTRFFRRLLHWGPPVDYAEPEFVLARLHDALRSRPRLCIERADKPEIEAFLPLLQERVMQAAPELLTDLRNALGLE